MCTALTFRAKDHYFGRNLDLPASYGESVTITPRNYPFSFRRAGTLTHHHALIGAALVAENYPLYFEASNEKGLSMAGLNFPGNACYHSEIPGRDNISPFELIPWLLGQCASLAEARPLLERLNLIDLPFSPKLPLAPLHWILSDREGSVTLESVREGLRIYDNPVGVLANNPPFPFHLENLSRYLHLTREIPANSFSSMLNLTPCSLGMGAVGLPGDLSSPSRFVRAAFTKCNAVSPEAEEAAVSQFFHILDAVAQPRGCARAEDDSYECTLYSSCCNTDRGLYYYTTYENRRISCVSLRAEPLDSEELISYPMLQEPDILCQNYTADPGELP